MIQPPIWNSDPQWGEQALSWIEAQLARHGRKLTAPLEPVRSFPWSLVLSGATDQGQVYFKAVPPDGRYEVRLTEALAAWEPNLTLPLLAADAERGWMLTPDGGPTLREAVRGGQTIAPWLEILPQYAAFQQRLAPRLDQLCQLGAPDQRLERLPDLYASLLAGEPWLRIGRPDGLTPAQVTRLQALAPRVAELAAGLASFGLPETINQADLNDANVFYPAGRFRLYDWGDANLSHPFFSLRVVRVSAEISLNWEDLDPRGEQLVEPYLRAWAAIGLSMEQLWQAYRLSQPLASLSRAVDWRRGLVNASLAERYDYQHVVPALLQEFLEFLPPA